MPIHNCIIPSSAPPAEEMPQVKRNHDVDRQEGNGGIGMARNLEEAWTDTLSRAAARLSTPSFNWLRDTRPASLKANTLTVTVPSEFAKNWIESHYREELSRAWKESWGSSCDLKFTVVAQEKMIASALFPADAIMPRDRKRRSSEDISQYLKGLNPRYVFENFIVGAGNRFAHAAALAVSETPSKVTTLFHIWRRGLGKTHLMQAIAHYVMFHHPSFKVCYVSSETFTNGNLRHSEGTTAEFRNRYRA